MRDIKILLIELLSITVISIFSCEQKKENKALKVEIDMTILEKEIIAI